MTERPQTPPPAHLPESTARIRQLVHAANNALGAARGQCEIALIGASENHRLEERMGIAIQAIDEAAELLRQLANPDRQPQASDGCPRNAPATELVLLSSNPELRRSTRELLQALGFTVRAVAHPEDWLIAGGGEPAWPKVWIYDATTVEHLDSLTRSHSGLRLLRLGGRSSEHLPGHRHARIDIPFSAERLRQAIESLLAQV